MILYFSVFNEQIFQFFITRSGIEMKAYPQKLSYFEILDSAIESMGYGQSDLHLLHDVYTTFYEGNIPESVEQIYVVPDNRFFQLPIEVLPVERPRTPHSYGSTQYLIEKYSVSYLNTFNDLLDEKTDNDFIYDLTGFGISSFSDAGHPELPDLPFSPQEVRISAEKLNQLERKEFFINESSTETNFRSIAGRSRIIHMATHSKVNADNPLFSALYMHTGSDADTTDNLPLNQSDGVIYAYELFDLNLNADLIFLSSCESGTGGYLEGTGILGFSRAFSYAGAQSLSMNLWPIRDQTASEISLRFYEAIDKGKDKAEALREARLHYLNNTNSDPYLWGAFVMYGDINSPVDRTSPFFTNLLFGFAVTGLVFSLIFIYQNKSRIREWAAI
jgi:CHAT domain-containing protein